MREQQKMKLKRGLVTLLAAAMLAAPSQTKAETQLLSLPAVGLIAGMIGGKVIGTQMGIAAFGTAISGKVPLMIAGGIAGTSLGAHLMALAAAAGAPTLSLAEGIAISAVIIRTAIAVANTDWEEVAENVAELRRRFGEAIRWAAATLGRMIGLETTLEASEGSTRFYRFTAPTVAAGAFNAVDAHRMTVVQYRRITNPGELVPDLAPRQETWKGQPIR